MAELKHQLNEISILRALHSPYIAAILDVFEDIDRIYIVQEFINGTNLFDFRMKHSLTEKATKSIFKGLALGLQYLTENGVAHRDIKLENIMIEANVDSTGNYHITPKFIDFGLSKVLLHGQTSSDRLGTLAYCSPEIIMGWRHSY